MLITVLAVSGTQKLQKLIERGTLYETSICPTKGKEKRAIVRLQKTLDYVADVGTGYRLLLYFQLYSDGWCLSCLYRFFF